MKWEKLNETEDDNIRFCQNCQKEVHFCETDEELVEAIKRNKCIGIPSPFDSNNTLVGLVEID
jgi:hypothetical protein